MSSRFAHRSAALSIASVALMGLTACGSTVTVDKPSSSTTTTSSTSSTSSASATSSTPSATTPTAQAVMEQMWANFKTAKSAKVVATGVEDGEKQKIEIAGTVDGKNQALTMTFGADTAVASLRTVDGKFYLQGDKGYWTKVGAPASTVATLVGKWVSVPATEAGALAGLTLKSLFDDMDKASFSSSEISSMKVTMVTENGQPAYQLESSESLLVITADGKGRLLHAKHKASKNGDEEYIFSDWDAVPPITAPADVMTM